MLKHTQLRGSAAGRAGAGLTCSGNGHAVTPPTNGDLPNLFCQPNCRQITATHLDRSGTVDLDTSRTVDLDTSGTVDLSRSVTVDLSRSATMGLYRLGGIDLDGSGEVNLDRFVTTYLDGSAMIERKRTNRSHLDRSVRADMDKSALTGLNGSVGENLESTAMSGRPWPSHRSGADTTRETAADGSGFCDVRISPPPAVGADAAPSMQPVAGRRTSSAPPERTVRPLLWWLALLAMSSLLVAVLAAVFLLTVTPVDGLARGLAGGRRSDARAATVRLRLQLHQLSVALSALSVCLNLCCLLVCTVQLVLVMKLVRPHDSNDSASAYLRQTSPSRVFAMVGYLVSIPVFLASVILYTFLQFHSTSLTTTGVVLALGVLFCALAAIHSVAVWRRVKQSRSVQARSTAVKTSTRHRSAATPRHLQRDGLAVATADLSRYLVSTSDVRELSTLV